MKKLDIKVIIPAFNEQNAVVNVIKEIPKDLVSEVIVIDNNSTDNTYQQAKDAGATALQEKRKGYGYACLKGLAYLSSSPKKPDIVVFIDGDYSDYPQQMYQIVQPIIDDTADIVIGSRTLGKKEKGAITPQQVIGNKIATSLMKLLYGVKYTDLGPFRAIAYDKLLTINMTDRTYGWTIEMQIKAAKLNLRYTEVPVNYRKRIGVSKVSGTVKGTIGAGTKICYTILKYL